MSGILSTISTNYKIVSSVVKTYATWNPADKSTNISLTVGDSRANNPNPTWGDVRSTISKSSGKWYWEITVTSGILTCIGITDGVPSPETTFTGQNQESAGYYQSDGNRLTNIAGTLVYNAFGAPYAPGDIIGIALDMDGKTVSCYKNGVSQGVLASSLTGSLFASSGIQSSETIANFGATPFAYSVPTGYNSGLYL